MKGLRRVALKKGNDPEDIDAGRELWRKMYPHEPAECQSDNRPAKRRRIVVNNNGNGPCCTPAILCEQGIRRQSLVQVCSSGQKQTTRSGVYP